MDAFDWLDAQGTKEAHAARDELAALRKDAERYREQRDELRRALEIIAVGDANNPEAQAAEELIALGYWRDIPEARKPVDAPGIGAA